MPTQADHAYKARKQPRQARAQASVDAIFEAAIQVLLAEGMPRLTTIRVAERAGVSVGTLYQYYPNKQALLFAVVQRHLERITGAMEAAALRAHGMTLAAMAPVIVAAFVKAKTERIDESRALYGVAMALGPQGLIHMPEDRIRKALADMLATASDARFADTAATSFMLAAALMGPVRLVIERGAPASMILGLQAELENLCLGYLERARAR
jgi:AcrR family transcriptional regulator